MKSHRLRAAPLGRRRTPEEITRLLEDHRQSGLSLLAFARKRQLCYSSLIRWRRRHPQLRRPSAAAPEPHPAFVPVQIEAGTWSSDYVLGWPSGRSLRIPPQFDSPSLRRLLGVLEEGA